MSHSVMLLSEIEEKDVINVVTGERIGYVSSLKIDTSTGRITAIAVQPMARLVSFFANKEDHVVIPWNQILKIGEDVIIVNLTEPVHSP